MLHYSQGIVDTVAKDSLVDIFPWLQVDMMDMLSKKQRSASPSIGYVIMLKTYFPYLHPYSVEITKQSQQSWKKKY